MQEVASEARMASLEHFICQEAVAACGSLGVDIVPKSDKSAILASMCMLFIALFLAVARGKEPGYEARVHVLQGM